MNKSLSALAFASIAVLAASAAHAQAQAPAANAAVRTERNMSLDLANRIATAAVAACSEKGYAVTTTVVDRAGTVRAVQRADNAGPHTLEASRAKAFTSASAKNTTLAMMENTQKTPLQQPWSTFLDSCWWVVACR